MLSRIINAGFAIACLILALALFRTGGIQQRPHSIPALPAHSHRALADDQALLDRQLAVVNFEDVTVEAALAWLSEQTSVNICTRWWQLQELSISKSATVRLQLRNVTLAQALRAIFATFDLRLVPSIDAKDGIITITTPRDLWRETSIESFNVRRLIEKLSGEGFGYGVTETVEEPKPRWRLSATVETLRLLITDHVSPDSWADNGGTACVIRSVGAILVVRQTPNNLRSIRDLLEELEQSIDTDRYSAAANSRARASLKTPHAADIDPSAAVTEFINLRPIVENIRLKGKKFSNWLGDYERTRNEILADIIKILEDTVEKDSWVENGGKVGDVRNLGGILAITQTPANIRACRLLLGELYRSTSSDDFSPASWPTTWPASVPGAQPATRP